MFIFFSILKLLNIRAIRDIKLFKINKLLTFIKTIIYKRISFCLMLLAYLKLSKVDDKVYSLLNIIGLAF